MQSTPEDRHLRLHLQVCAVRWLGTYRGRKTKGGIMKRKTGIILSGLLALTFAAAAQVPKPKQERRTVTMVLDHTVLNLEEEFVPAAKAMPEEKFGFAPTNGEFKGVRTF